MVKKSHGRPTNPKPKKVGTNPPSGDGHYIKRDSRTGRFIDTSSGTAMPRGRNKDRSGTNNTGPKNGKKDK